MITAMATPIGSQSSHAILISEGGHNHYSSIPARHRLKRNRNLAILFKFLQLMIAIACLVLFSADGQLYSDVSRTALAYGTFGAYIIIPIFLIVGFIIGEVTPILLVGYNLFGAVLFGFVAAYGIDTWWSVQSDLDHISMANVYKIEHVNDMKLISAILSAINAVFYAADAVVEGVILHDSYNRFQ